MSVLNNSNAIETGGYNIQRSLRFRSSASAYLSRTPASSGNLTTWTWSGWVKRGGITSTGNSLFGSGANNTNDCWLEFSNATDCLDFMVRDASTIRCRLITTQVFRDPSAWYHLVLVWNSGDATASNRAKLYINGVQVISFSTATYPAQNTNSLFNSATTLYIARARADSPDYLDGYLAEVNFIDGQALTPTSFGQTDPVTGVWTPKKYTGTYGTNGFYLPFTDNTSATTLAYDKSGNGNNWTPNNISTTAGATYDSMTDVPTLTSATAANFATLNPLDRTATGGSWTDGNLTFSYNSTGTASRSTLSASSGKYVAQCLVTAISGNINFGLFGTNTSINSPNTNDIYYRSTGQKVINGTVTSYGASYTTNDVIRVEADFDAGSVTFFKNGVSQGAISYTLNTGYSFVVYNGSGTTVKLNFGQQPWFNSETPTTGFKALNTYNLPDPVIKKPNQYMDATLWTGTNTSQSITNSGAMQPDMIWLKSRNVAGTNHRIVDSVRGLPSVLKPSATTAEGTDVDVSAFNSNGFSVSGSGSGEGNDSTDNYVGWQWKKGATPGFDIVTFNSTVAAQTVSHNLGVAPSMIILKNRAVADGWYVYHKSLGATQGIYLHLTNAATSASWWNNTAPTSSVFSVNMGNAYAQVAYLFAEIAGFSKFGSYTGNGAAGEPNADGPFIFTGFRPRYVMVKRSDSTSDWNILDTSRNTYNVAGSGIYANLSAAEGAGDYVDFLSNGFKIRDSGTGFNASGGTYIFAAFAENPFKYSLAR